MIIHTAGNSVSIKTIMTNCHKASSPKKLPIQTHPKKTAFTVYFKFYADISRNLAAKIMIPLSKVQFA